MFQPQQPRQARDQPPEIGDPAQHGRAIEYRLQAWVFVFLADGRGGRDGQEEEAEVDEFREVGAGKGGVHGGGECGRDLGGAGKG